MAYTGMPATAALLSFEIGTCVAVSGLQKNPKTIEKVGGEDRAVRNVRMQAAWWRRGFCFRIWGELDSVESNHNLGTSKWANPTRTTTYILED